jgi:hypothetical protein
MNQAILLTNKDVSPKALRGLMKEVAEEAREKAILADKILNDRIKQELSDLIKKRNV